jgi:molecular chaperone DnaK (HSP70)
MYVAVKAIFLYNISLSITIPALPAEITSNITIKMSKRKTLQIKSMHTDEISKIARTAAETRARLDNQKNLLIEKISKIDENLNSTFKYIAEEAKNTEKNIWNSITSVFKPWIYGAAGLALLIMLLFCCLSFSFRKFQQKIDAAQSRTYIQPRPNRTTNL